MNVVLTLFDPVVDIGYPAFITFQVINFDVLSIPPVSSSYHRPSTTTDSYLNLKNLQYDPVQFNIAIKGQVQG